MKTKHLILLSIVVPVLLVLSLGYVTLKRDKPTGFNRKFVNIASVQGEVKSNFKLTGICGTSSNHIYFRTNHPNHIISFDKALQNFSSFQINIQLTQKIRNSFSIEVDSPTVMIFAGNNPSVFLTNLNTPDSGREIHFDTRFFQNAVSLSAGSFVLRSYSPKEKDFQLHKAGIDGAIKLIENNTSIVMHEKGIKTQTNLLFNKDDNRIYMVYMLFNRILCLDTNFNLIYSAKTIDTITTPNIKYAEVSKNGTRTGTFSTPPLYTNYKARIVGKYLFVHSRIKADNELQVGPTIDVYLLGDGSYKHSFQLPYSGRQTLTDFRVNGNLLTALYTGDNKVFNYKLTN